MDHKSMRPGRRFIVPALLLGTLTLGLPTAHAGSNRIEGIDVQGEGETRTVRISTNSTPTFTVFRLNDPMRVVVDISGAELGDVRGPRVVEDGVIDQIAVRQFRSEGFVIGRVVVGFEHDSGYDVQAEGNSVVLRAMPSSEMGRAAPPPEGPADRAAAERLASTRAAAEKAAKDAERDRDSATKERSRAEAALATAQQQKEQAARQADEAAQLAGKAAAAQAEAQRLQQQAEQSVAASRASAEAEAQAAAQRAANLEKASKLAAEKASSAEAARVAAEAASKEHAQREADLQAKLAQAEGALEQNHSQPILVGIESTAPGQFLLQLQGGTANYSSERVDRPARLVIDLPRAQRQTRSLTFGFDSPLVKRVRLGDQQDGVRVVFDLPGNDVTSEIKSVSGGLLVALQRQEGPTGGAVQQPPPEAAPGTLSDVRFSRGDGGSARITLTVQSEVAPQLDQQSARAWVLKFPSLHVASGQERSLDTAAYDTVVRLVSTYQGAADVAHVVANLTGPAESDLKREGNTWVWEIRGTGPHHSPVARRQPAVSGTAPQTAGFAAQAASMARFSPTQSRDNRKRISLDVKDADIINVLRLISEETGENIIASDDVRGKVTLKLRNVPADQALDTMLRTKGFDKVRQNNILRIAPAEAIQKERDLELAKKRSQTEVEETLIKMVTVNYATASEIVDQIKPMLTGRGSSQVDARTNTIILQDIASNVDRLVELTRRLDKQTPLVMIQARIVEASSTYARDLGIQWGGSSQETAATGNPTGLMFPGDIRANGGADAPTGNQAAGVSTPAHYAVNLPAALNNAGGAIGLILGSAGQSQILNLRLSAMETNGTAKIISSPEVATLDNKTAHVSQGVQIPISVVSAAGTNTRFIPAVLELEVTPHVTNDGTVLLKIKTQKSEPDFANKGANGDPTIQSKAAETEVLVRDGDTSVIGGIYTRNTSENYREVPFLARIPILGNLFREHASSDARAELLIFITPRIINREESMVQNSNIEPTQGPNDE